MCPDGKGGLNPFFQSPNFPISGTLIYVRFGDATIAKNRLSGTALAQCYNQLGSIDDVPDVDDCEIFTNAFNATQQLIGGGYECNQDILCPISRRPNHRRS
jgi:hypothetical protein